MKQRFSSLDVKVMAHELADSIVGLRLSNIYDLTARIMLFKFAKPDNKKQMVVESGFRCHLTDFARTTSSVPSSFVSRLRKFLKTRRVTAVAQVGTDRVLEFQFSDGLFRLYLEFFAGGNVILTDAKHAILVILRNVPETAAQQPQRVGVQYSMDKRQNIGGVPDLTRERVQGALEGAMERATKDAAAGKKAKVKPGEALRRCLALNITELPPMLFEHSFELAGFDATLSPAQVLESPARLDHLVQALAKGREILEAITKTPVCPGYIFAKERPKTELGQAAAAPAATAPAPPAPEAPEKETKSESKRDDLIYEDYRPFLPYKLEKDANIHVLEYETFNKAVDEYFSSIEGQKLESRLAERELTAQRKLEATRRDQASRVEGFQEAQSLNIRKADAIEANIERVEEAMAAVGGLLDQGMDWVDIGKLVEREQKRGNPVAQTIKLPLRLNESIITLMLGEGTTQAEDDADEVDETDDEEDSDEEDQGAGSQKARAAADARLLVDINITISPWANAREYYDQKRTAASKQAKTLKQSEIALKNAEKKITSELKKDLAQEKALMHAIRTPMWFEKFHWFVSSDGYLVVGGRDPSQSEILYRRYLRKGDVYCHADQRGAASVIVKNKPNTPDAPIPPSTLSQAGSLAVSSSNAWDSKATVGAWWVAAEQVTKETPHGDYLPAGEFAVKGDKYFLPPAQLLVGLGVVFRISAESKARHVKHRVGEGETVEAGVAVGAGAEAVEDDGGSGGDSDEEGEGLDDAQRENPLQPRREGEQDDGGGSDDGSDDGVSKQLESLDIEADRGEGADGEKPAGDGKPAEDEAPADKRTDEEPVEEDRPADDDEQKDDNDEAPGQEDECHGALKDEQPAASKVHVRPQPAQQKPAAAAKKMSKAKAKKMAKYKDQDDEDREAFETLTGAKAGRERAEALAKEKAAKEAEAAAQQARRRAQHTKQQKATAEHEKARRALMEDGPATGGGGGGGGAAAAAAAAAAADAFEADEADVAITAAALDTLVGTPLPGDEILEVVPMCAPWGALARCKYKAKMQPGQVKKGKAVKEILERWRSDSARKGAVDESATDAEKMWPREVALLKTLKPEEVVNCVPVGRVRVMMSGGSGGGGKSGGGGGSGKSGGGGGGGKGGKGKGKR